MLVGCQPIAQPELRIVLEQRIRPGRPTALAVGSPGCHRQVAAIDGRAPGGVGDLQTVAEQLRQQLQIRRLAATRAGAGIDEQGSRNCTPRTLAKSTRARSLTGSEAKNALSPRAGSSSSSLSFIASDLIGTTGQAST